MLQGWNLHIIFFSGECFVCPSNIIANASSEYTFFAMGTLIKKGKLYNLLAFSDFGFIPILTQTSNPSRIDFIVSFIIFESLANALPLPEVMTPAYKPAATYNV